MQPYNESFRKMTRVYLASLIVGTALAGCSEWPPLASEFSSDMANDRAQFEAVREAFVTLEYPMVFSTRGAGGIRVEASNDSERWIDFAEGHDEEQLNIQMAELGVVAIVNLDGDTRFDTGFRDIGRRTFAISYLFAESEIDLRACDESDSEQDFGECAVELDENWHLLYRWFLRE